MTTVSGDALISHISADSNRLTLLIIAAATLAWLIVWPAWVIFISRDAKGSKSKEGRRRFRAIFIAAGIAPMVMVIAAITVVVAFTPAYDAAAREISKQARAAWPAQLGGASALVTSADLHRAQNGTPANRLIPQRGTAPCTLMVTPQGAPDVVEVRLSCPASTVQPILPQDRP